MVVSFNEMHEFCNEFKAILYANLGYCIITNQTFSFPFPGLTVYVSQTRTRIGLLGKPPTVKQFPPSEATSCMRLLRGPRANAGMKRTSVVEHNLYFAGLAMVG